ncbi:MAG: hypothetical protein KUG64_07885 [Cycloclasticus sp.]|nr:hypothetical protein [Cycloclasticus sp.]
MNTFKYIILILVLVFTSEATIAAEIRQKTLESLTKLSGIDEGFNEHADTVKQRTYKQLRAQKISLSEQELDEMNKAIDENFSNSSFLHEVTAEIKKSVSEEDAQQLLVWLKSDSWKAITKAVSKDTSTEDEADMLKMYEAPEILMSDQQRTSYVAEIEELTKITELIMNLQVNAQSIALETCSCPKDLNHEILQKAKDRLTASLLESTDTMKQSLHMYFMFVYRDINNSELQKYVDFLDQPYSHTLNDAVSKGIRSGYHNANINLQKSWSLPNQKCAKQPEKL